MKKAQRRLLFVWGVFFIFGAVIGWRLFNIQILKAKDYKENFADQKRAVLEKKEERKEIFAQTKTGDRVPLAINKQLQSIYINSSNVKAEKVDRICKKVRQILTEEKRSQVEFLNSCDERSGFRIIKRGISQKEAEKISELDFKGVGVKPEIVRNYPQKELSSHITGFLGYEGHKRKGQYGLEAFYDDYLKKEKNKQGALVTTIDHNIQYQAKKLLKEALEKYEAESGSITVSDPGTGAIKAMAVLSDYDPNKYNQYDNYSLFLNPVVSKVYEPGSIFKPIVMAGGLQEGVIKPESTFYDKGHTEVTGETIYNAREKKHEESTMVDVLAESINTGAVFVQQELGQAKFKKYVKKFGFGEKTGVDLPYEAKGSILNLFTGRPINYATAAFGQGISVTPIQIINAFNAIANNGVAPQPHLLDLEKTEIKQKSFSEKRLISNETAGRLTSMLVEVVERGHAKPARIPSYYIAGKTGTAQVSKEESAGYSDETIHSFVGFAPAYEPEFVVLVKLNAPQEGRFSSDTAVPLFQKMIKYLLNYYEVHPTRDSS